jgi:hypothetical protein
MMGRQAAQKAFRLSRKQQHSPKEYTVRGRMSGRFALRERTGEIRDLDARACAEGLLPGGAVEAWRRRMLSC